MRPTTKHLLGVLCFLGVLLATWKILAAQGDSAGLGGNPPPALPTNLAADAMGGSEGPLAQLEDIAEPSIPARVDTTYAPRMPEKRVFEGPLGPFQLAVRILDSRSMEPIEHYLVAIALTGTSDPSDIPLAQRLPTNAEGECLWPALGEIGPWDVFVSPIGNEGALFALEDITRVATIMGRSVLDPPPLEAPDDAAQGDKGIHDVLVKTGPQVTYRGPLPRGLTAEDLRFDIRGRVHGYSSDGYTTGGIARGRRTPEGWVKAAIPYVSNFFIGPNFAVRIWTADGNFGAVSIHPGTLTNETDVVVEGPLKSRAKVRFRIELEASDDGSFAATAREIADAISWEPLGDDPERNAAGLKDLALAGPSARQVVQVGPSTFEIGDLPPIAISFRGWRYHSDIGRRVQPPDGIRATARHGKPRVTVLRLRPVR